MKRLIASFLLAFLILFRAGNVSGLTDNMSANVVVGQLNFNGTSANQGGSASSTSLSGPRGIVVINGKLIVSDGTNNRVLIWNSIPTTNGVAADVVIGQQNFTGVSANQGGTAGANTLSLPRGLDTDGTKLFIADDSNRRVLIYNTVPTTNNASADVVIGQPDFTTTSSGASTTKYTSGRGVSYDSTTGKLAVLDGSADRLLIYNSVPTANGAAADVVVGQTSFTATGSGCNAAKFNTGAQNVRMFNGKIIMADSNNRRTLIFNSIPTSNGASADVVMGQTSFISCSSRTTGASTLAGPIDTAFDGNRLFITDNTSRRVLVFNGIPTINDAPAYQVIGQSSFSGNSANQGGSAAANTLGGAQGIYYYGSKLFVADTANHRVLIYDDQTKLPAVSLTNDVVGIGNGLFKMEGTTTTESPYSIRDVFFAVNDGDYLPATATDGAYDSIFENYYFHFNPLWAGNSDASDYAIRIKSRNSNLDRTDNLFYFSPFRIGEVDKSTSFPAFQFSVSSKLNRLKDSLSRYQIQVKKGNGDWKIYLDNIPVSGAQNVSGDVNAHQTNEAYINYSTDRSRIKVRAVGGGTQTRLFEEGGKILRGAYKWKVVAVDKAGHTQETEVREAVFSGQGASSFVNGEYFPISILNISGVSGVHISSNDTASLGRNIFISSVRPTMRGIAFSGSAVTVTITKQNCTVNCSQIASGTVGIDSRFSVTVPENLELGQKYEVSVSVSGAGKYNEIAFYLQRNQTEAKTSTKDIVLGAKTQEIPQEQGIKLPKLPVLCVAFVCF
jgi:hypothetical protein